MSFINFNNEILPATQAVLTVDNRAYKYGDGLFESMRLVDGRLLFAKRHSERLQAGMEAMELEGRWSYSPEFLTEKAEELAQMNDISNGRLRMSVFRNGEGLYSPVGNESAYSIEISPLNESSYSANSKGLLMDVYQGMTKPVNFLSRYKTSNSLLFIMAALHKKKRSLDDVFILNEHGFLCETMSSNIFIQFEKNLYTPALEEGCIGGVMRSVVMELANELGMQVIEAQINPDILNVAEEVFITNTVKGIQWVMGFNSKRYFYQSSRRLLDTLNNNLHLY